jgi:hypothetical protein
MGVLSDLFVAERPDVAIEEGGPTTDGRFPSTDVKGLDQVKLGALAQLVFEGALESGDEGLYGKTYLNLMREMSEPLHEDSEDGPWVFPIPERFRAALAGLGDDEMPALASNWSEIEEFQADHLTEEDALEYLRELKRLAQAAIAPNRLFLWMSL